ncbi:MAG: hypothetical protein EU548_07725 [Promethearchaeota archaeon]|nr:MAG: hypothetical protein EU548_07725 [Candidatus Lokiarchaeota archaeon]
MVFNEGDFAIRKRKFIQKMQWFENEFEELFGGKTHLMTKEDRDLANDLLDRLSEVINQYQEKEDARLLPILSETLKRIEKHYPELFLDLDYKNHEK